MTPGSQATRSARVGRRPGAESTRTTVLAAASARFASDGYAATTIRRIATDAGVDPSQVMQFFGSKDALFAAVMAVPASALARFDTAFDGPSEHLGERVVRAFLEAWEAPGEESEPLMTMLRGAVVNEEANTQLREFIEARLEHGAGAVDHDHRALRAGLAAAMLVGIITSRRIIGVPTLVAANHDRIVETVGPAIQSVLTPPSPVV
ncbi:TetR/AcrR family transcriptional regulator [Curtobacterium sp. Leaf261]|uniref:TetR/AcrR family transcriptional regulator n=1 Tax=Curtobacterium sp. Leaf261 TaxID=1736311 RepID=UPI0006FE17B4|nr:TetR family transcriptional regulator [Curtobacterium sp. Leaf261]KQO60060.1 transcriptional regulator [Curtobacterium sp. Leaf261]